MLLQPLSTIYEKAGELPSVDSLGFDMTNQMKNYVRSSRAFENGIREFLDIGEKNYNLTNLMSRHLIDT